MNRWSDRSIQEKSAHVTVAALLLLLTLAPLSSAHADLWLYPDSESPRAGGHVVHVGSFTLHVNNRGGGNTTDGIAHGVVLAVAVNDPALLTGATLALPDGSDVSIDAAALQEGTPTLPCSDRAFPRHSEYPAFFTTVPLGDIATDEVVDVGVEIEGTEGLRVHFDAFGTAYHQTGRTTRCLDVTNPAGHDVTAVLDGEGGTGADCHELEIEKLATATGVDVGAELDYLIKVTNTGTCELTGVTLTENLPTVPDGVGTVPAFTVLAVTPPATTQGTTEIRWELGALAPGAAVTVTVHVVFDQPLAEGTRVVNVACVAAEELERDECSRAKVAVGPTQGGTGGPGFWCNQIRFAKAGRHNAKVTVDLLNGWLAEIGTSSSVFSELHDASTVELAQALLCSPSLAEDAGDRLARHLLTLWLNVASGRLDPALTLGELCEGSEPPPPDLDPAATVASVLAGAEAALVAGADAATLGTWQELVDYVNNARTPGDAGCGQMRRHFRGRH